MRKFFLMIAVVISSLTISSCSLQNNGYESISIAEAKELMEKESNYIILDVRTLEEFNSGHIPNAILIPNEEIKEKATSILKDKNQLILVYCRSGNRSKQAANALVSLGYTNIKEFGGIIDWPYEIVK